MATLPRICKPSCQATPILRFGCLVMLRTPPRPRRWYWSHSSLHARRASKVQVIHVAPCFRNLVEDAMRQSGSPIRPKTYTSDLHFSFSLIPLLPTRFTLQLNHSSPPAQSLSSSLLSVSSILPHSSLPLIMDDGMYWEFGSPLSFYDDTLDPALLYIFPSIVQGPSAAALNSEYNRIDAFGQLPDL